MISIHICDLNASRLETTHNDPLTKIGTEADAEGGSQKDESQQNPIPTEEVAFSGIDSIHREIRERSRFVRYALALNKILLTSAIPIDLICHNS
jgi:hypothetical protein